jgi:hypothetical protein
MRRLPVAVLCAVILAVGPSMLVQVLGWSSMLVTRLARQPAAEAITTTFDGSRPCVFCRVAKRLDQDGDSAGGRQTSKEKPRKTSLPLPMQLPSLALAARMPADAVPSRTVVSRPAVIDGPDPPPPRG